jgi:hypothetical protein
MDGVVTCLLTAISLLAFLRLRYPATYDLPRIGDASAAANQGGGRRRPDVEASV